MNATKIEWTDRTWNPTTGCTKVSPGCDHCYAEGIAHRFAGTKAFPNGFDATLHPERLDAPLTWRKPSKVFVNSMSDLFHQDVPDEFIVKVFVTMALATRHTFQVLTKRHGRMRSLLGSDAFRVEVAARLTVNGGFLDPEPAAWPLRNVWLGVSVEDQQRADLRVPALLGTPAAVRFLSCEPLLGPVDLTRVADQAASVLVFDALNGQYGIPGAWHAAAVAGIDWVIVGGESGPGARPVHPDWVRDLRDQCMAACVPFFFKQAGRVLAQEWGCSSSKGDDPSEWPETFPREFPDAA